MKTTEKISKKMIVLLFIPLTIPSFSLVGFALSDFGKEGASTMLLIAFILFFINIAVFFFAYRFLNQPDTPTTDN